MFPTHPTTLHEQVISAAVAHKKQQDLFHRSLTVINDVAKGRYAVIIGPCVEQLIVGIVPNTITVVTDDATLKGVDSLSNVPLRNIYHHLTTEQPGVHAFCCAGVSFPEMLQAIRPKENRLHIRSDGLWYYSNYFCLS